MILITDKKDCCGCGACAQICPKKCITMKEDYEGFLYPIVDTIECINCNLCGKACPVLNKTDDKRLPLATYIAYYKNLDIRLNSSSGGLFSALSSWILAEGGCVYGAAFDNDFMVHHIRVLSEEHMKLLRGSKYLQSRTENTFAEVKRDLQKGKKVLYSGTACQIGGLKAFLGKEYENLYTIDILCHGVPSPKVWKKYLTEQEDEHGAAVQRTFFRHKKWGWKMFAVSLEFSDDTVYERIFTKDAFMQMFLYNICLRPSCHACKFKDMNRPSDITLGDCWGIENYMPEMDDDKGASIVLVHTEKGQKWLQSISYELEIVSAELDQVLPPYSDSRKSVAVHLMRDKYFRMLNKDVSMKKLSDLLKPTIKVKIRRFLRRVKNKLSG